MNSDFQGFINFEMIVKNFETRFKSEQVLAYLSALYEKGYISYFRTKNSNIKEKHIPLNIFDITKIKNSPFKDFVISDHQPDMIVHSPIIPAYDYKQSFLIQELIDILGFIYKYYESIFKNNNLSILNDNLTLFMLYNSILVVSDTCYILNSDFMSKYVFKEFSEITEDDVSLYKMLMV